MSVLSTAAATAYGNRAQWHPAFSRPTRRKAQKSSGFRASGTYGHCIKDNVLMDPAAGSGSLLIRAADEAPVGEDGNSIVTIFGQDNSTSGLARMNLILHQKGTGTILKGNTLTNPQFTDDFGQLRRFDFVVMNPPFSDKDWSDWLCRRQGRGVRLSAEKGQG